MICVTLLLSNVRYYALYLVGLRSRLSRPSNPHVAQTDHVTVGNGVTEVCLKRKINTNILSGSQNPRA